MGQQTDSMLNRVVSDTEFNDLIVTLDRMFEGDFTNKQSKSFKKAELTFKNMKLRKWTVSEFRETMKQLEKRWTSIYWMPADILKIHANLYGEDRLDDEVLD